MYLRSQILLWAILAAFGMSCCDGMGAPSNKTAKSIVKPAAKGNAAAAVAAKANAAVATQHHNHAILAHVLHELHQAKHLLDIGLHDYHGHRAKADAEIKKAIHVLEHHKGHHKSGTATHPHAKNKHAHHGPVTQQQQSASDLKLRQAEKLVHAAIHQLHHQHSQGKEHQHAVKAVHLLREADHEIQAALHVVHHYNKHQQTVAGVAKP